MDIQKIKKGRVDKRRSGNRCAVPICRLSKRDDNEIRLFNFPIKDKLKRKIRLSSCNLDDIANLMICSKHFQKNYFAKKYLKKPQCQHCI